MKFIPNGPIDAKPALIQIMAWRRMCDKSSLEQLATKLAGAYIVTRPQELIRHLDTN